MNFFIVEDSGIEDDEPIASLPEIPCINEIENAVGEQDTIEQIGVAPPDMVIFDMGLRPGSGISAPEPIKKNEQPSGSW